MVQEVFSWLPVATIVDNSVFIVHGGISDRINLNVIQALPRNKVMIYFSQLIDMTVMMPHYLEVYKQDMNSNILLVKVTLI